MLDSGIHELLHGVKTNYLEPMLDQIVEEEVGPKYVTESMSGTIALVQSYVFH
jgi:hypothetical protein